MKSTKKLGCLFVLVVLPIILIVAFLLILTVRESVNRAELNRELDALVAAGKR